MIRIETVQENEVVALLKELNCQGSTVVMVTHSLDCAWQGHRTLNLPDGRLTGVSL